MYSVGCSEYTVSFVRNAQCRFFGIYSVSCSDCTVSVVRNVQCRLFGIYSVSCSECTVSVVRNVHCRLFGMYSVGCSECTVSVVRNVQCQLFGMYSVSCSEFTVSFPRRQRGLFRDRPFSEYQILHNIIFSVSKQISTKEYFICTQLVTYKLKSFLTSPCLQSYQHFTRNV